MDANKLAQMIEHYRVMDECDLEAIRSRMQALGEESQIALRRVLTDRKIEALHRNRARAEEDAAAREAAAAIAAAATVKPAVATKAVPRRAVSSGAVGRAAAVREPAPQKPASQASATPSPPSVAAQRAMPVVKVLYYVGIPAFALGFLLRPAQNVDAFIQSAIEAVLLAALAYTLLRVKGLLFGRG